MLIENRTKNAPKKVKKNNAINYYTHPHRGKMDQIFVEATDGHAAFTISLRLDASFTMAPRALYSNLDAPPLARALRESVAHDAVCPHVPPRAADPLLVRWFESICRLKNRRKEQRGRTKQNNQTRITPSKIDETR